MDHYVMKCPSDCTCDRHMTLGEIIKARMNSRERKIAEKPPNNTTFMPEREHLSTTYGDQQRERCQRAMKERHARGIAWRATPSEDFDWDRAIEGFKQIMKERYEQ